MSARSDVRYIAKARLKALGVPHVNKVFGVKSDYREPLWKSVTTGDLAARGFEAQMAYKNRRKAAWYR
jgi:hypothetical protein